MIEVDSIHFLLPWLAPKLSYINQHVENLTKCRAVRALRKTNKFIQSSIHLSVPWLINHPWFSSVCRFRRLCKRLPVCHPVCRSYSISGSTFRGICLFSRGSFPHSDHGSICGTFRLRSVLLGYETSPISQKNWNQSDVLHFKASRIIHFC